MSVFKTAFDRTKTSICNLDFTLAIRSLQLMLNKYVMNPFFDFYAFLYFLFTNTFPRLDGAREHIESLALGRITIPKLSPTFSFRKQRLVFGSSQFSQ